MSRRRRQRPGILFLGFLVFVACWPAIVWPDTLGFILTALWWTGLAYIFRHRRGHAWYRYLREVYREWRHPYHHYQPGRQFSPSVKRRIWIRDGGRCVSCGTTKNLQYDHIYPYSRGGKSTFDNGQLLCGRENRAKGAKIRWRPRAF
jgi:hypothetical protein